MILSHEQRFRFCNAFFYVPLLYVKLLPYHSRIGLFPLAVLPGLRDGCRGSLPFWCHFGFDQFFPTGRMVMRTFPFPLTMALKKRGTSPAQAIALCKRRSAGNKNEFSADCISSCNALKLYRRSYAKVFSLIAQRKVVFRQKGRGHLLATGNPAEAYRCP